jgi:hydrogenase maturation protease
VKSLVIGYGNDLRSDDGAGRVVADRIAAMGLADVAVRSMSQLTPELSLEMAQVDIVVFIDASIEVSTTTTAPVKPASAQPSAMSHFSTPESLLAMTASIGAVPSRAFTVSIPAADLSLGFELTPETELAVEQAVAMVTSLIVLG